MMIVYQRHFVNQCTFLVHLCSVPVTVGTSLWGDDHDKELDAETRAELPVAHGNRLTKVLEHEHLPTGPSVRTSQIANSVVNDCVQNAGDQHSGDK